MAGLDAKVGSSNAEYLSLLRMEIPRELNLFKGRLSPRFYEMHKQVSTFIRDEIIPQIDTYNAQLKELEKKVAHPTLAPEPPILKELRSRARAKGLLNFFLPEVCKLTILEYAPIAEILGSIPLANYAMNCSAPDTGNMEVLERYGTAEQKRTWLQPLLNGEIRSAFAMTEPGVASSDATNISSTIKRDGSEYVVNGHKWYISGACRPECKIFIFLGKTSDEGPIHKQHSMVIVPRDAPGVTILRPLGVFGHEHDHAEIIFENVRIPVTNLLLGEGQGFEIAQGRLGPGRIHHAMRTIGTADIALEAILYRVQKRVAFGAVLANKDTIRQQIAEAKLDITKSRLLCYMAAAEADDHGFKDARVAVAMTKVDAPRTCLKVLDEAIQIHGAHGVSQDSLLTDLYASIRTLRVADGPDIVHLTTIAKAELSKPLTQHGKRVSGVNTNIEHYGKFKDVKPRLSGRGAMIARL